MHDRSPGGRSFTDLPIVFFDGVCNLCNGYVDFMMRRDRQGRFRFASLQGEIARTRLGETLRASGDIPSIVLLDEQGIHARSAAVLRMLTGLGGPWHLLRLLQCLPSPLLDAFYDFVAARRVRWFGRRETCRVPTPSDRDRLLD
jgi:predicted DCC family thiol-disulfide oxidoreductase YuxK